MKYFQQIYSIMIQNGKMIRVSILSFYCTKSNNPPPLKKTQIKQIIFNQCNLLTYLHISGTCQYTIKEFTFTK